MAENGALCRLCAYAYAEITVKNSRFIAELFPVSDQKQAREKLREQKERYADAAHVVHAFIAGSGAEVMGMSDDGEPPGTAGRPVLDVLKGRRCTNLLLTVARYFGGTLLGTGGLVKAYGDAAKAVLAAAVFETLTAKSTFSCTVPYQLASQIKRYLCGIGAQHIEETYETEVTIRCRVDTARTQALAAFITDLTNGQRRAVIQDER